MYSSIEKSTTIIRRHLFSKEAPRAKLVAFALLSISFDSYAEIGSGACDSLDPLCGLSAPITLDTVTSHGTRLNWWEIPSVDLHFMLANGHIPVSYWTFLMNTNFGVSGRTPTGGCQVLAGNPVIFSTGNKVEEESDFVGQGEMPLRFSRAYNHYLNYAPAGGVLGFRWITSFDYRLSMPSDWSYINVHRPDGRVTKFVRAPDGIWYEDKPSAVAKIVFSSLKFTLYNEDGISTEEYNAYGHIFKLLNQRGVGWTFQYGTAPGGKIYLKKVTHTSGRFVEFIWDGDFATLGGQIWPKTMIDPGGNQYSFTFKWIGAQRLLASITIPGTPATTIQYHYENATFPDALTGKSYNGVRYSTFAYDANARAASTEHAGAVDRFSFSYTVNASDRVTQTVVTNPLGKQATYSFNNKEQVVSVTGHPSARCPSSYKDSTFDANGYEDIVSDFEGNLTNFDYNAKGQLLQKIEAAGTPLARTTTYQWDGLTNRLSSFTILGHSKTEFGYTSNGRVSYTTVTNLSSSGVANQSRTTTYSYTSHPNGMLATSTSDGPIPGTGDSVVSSYNAYGDLVMTTNGLGHSTTYSNHNALGLPGRVVGANGETKDYTYDARGRVLQLRTYINGVAADTIYVYRTDGLIGSITTPDGVTESFSYDAARRLIERNRLEVNGTVSATKYSYNAMSLPVSVTTVRK